MNNKDGQWGYVDRDGKAVIPFKFKYAGQFDQGMATVSVNDKFFFVNKEGAIRPIGKQPIWKPQVRAEV